MSDEGNAASRPKSIPASPAVPKALSPGADPPRAARPTQRMSAEEIAEAIEHHRNRTDDGEDDNTVVLDPVDDAAENASDDAPTADYDPRARIVHRATPAPVMPVVPPPDALRADGARRRSSRRTVKIPDESVRRAPEPAPPPVEVIAPPPLAVDYDAPTPLPATREVEPPSPADANNEPLPIEPPVDPNAVLRPLRIISIGSDPPPQITSAEAPWPSAADERSPASAALNPPSSEVDTVRKVVASTTKTDLLPPPVVLEDGWTPEPTGALLATSIPETALREPRVPAIDAPTPRDPDGIDVDVETSDISAEGEDLIEDLEPEASAHKDEAARKPPPVPPRERPAVEAKPVVVEPVKPKIKPWFEDVFSEDYIKTMDILPPENVRQEVDFIEESLGVERDAVILDLACGRGELAVELSLRGYNVVGIDLSPVALAASHENLRREKAAHEKIVNASANPAAYPTPGKPSFLRSDMRDLDFQENFDGAYCWSTSFGYFDDETNLDVLRRLHRALRQGGMLLIDVINRDFVAPRSPSLVWFEGDGCVCMDDMAVDFLTSRLKVKRTAMFDDGHSREVEYSIRLYSLDTLGKMLHEVGFRVVEATGLLAHPGIFFGTESPRLIVLAERA